MTSRSSRRFGVLLWAQLAALGWSHARADPIVGPPFELDEPVWGAPSWAEQQPAAVAARRGGGVLVTWFDYDRTLTGPADARLMLLATLVAADGTTPATPTRLPYLGYPFAPIAAAGVTDGYLVVHREEQGIVALRLDVDGRPLDEEPRLLVPGATIPDKLDLACDDRGDDCLLLWLSPGPTGWTLHSASFGWTRSASPVVILAQDDDQWHQPTGSVAFAGGVFAVAYSSRQVFGPARKLSVQMVAADGQPTTDAIELPFPDNVSWPRLARLGEGFLLVFQEVPEDTVHTSAVRLDETGAIVGEVIRLTPASSIAAAVSEGDAVAVFQRGNFIAERIDSRGDVSVFPVPGYSRPMGVAFDGARYWLSVGNEDVMLAPTSSDAQVVEDWSLLSAATNSQWLFDPTIGRDGDAIHTLVAWRDNATVAPRAPRIQWPVQVQAFGPDGCPLRRAQPVSADPAFEIAGISADADGFAVLGTESDSPASLALQRLRFDGTRVGDPQPVDLAVGLSTVRAGVGGGFTLTSLSPPRAVVLDGWGTIVADVEIPYTGGARVIAATVGDEVAVLSYHGDCQPDGSCFNVTLEIDFRDFDGRESHAPVVESLEDGLAFQLFTTAAGYVVVLSDGFTTWRAGLLSPTGDWSGLSTIEVPGPARTEAANVIVQDGELWWLTIGDATLSDPGELWIVRTTTQFELLESTSLAMAAPGVGNVALVPASPMPSLLSSYQLVVPRSLRVAGRRLDGTECAMPELPEDAAGCACRTSRPPAPMDGLTFIGVWLVIRRMRRQAPARSER